MKIILLLLLLTVTCWTQEELELPAKDGPVKGMRRVSPFSSWTKYIHCDTCEYAADKLWYMYDSFRNGEEWGEDTLIDILHDICNPFANIGLWITTIDCMILIYCTQSQ